MWGKVSFQRSRKPSATTTEVHTYQSSSLSGPQRNDMYSKALPTLPPDSSNPGYLEPNPPRITSSIYSRDDDTFDHLRQRSISETYQFSQEPALLSTNHNNTYSETRSVDISPPSSPITRVHSQNSSRVSPIEDESSKVATGNANLGQPDNKYASHIPILRKRLDLAQPDRAQQPKPVVTPNVTRWDNFSGEPTHSSSGKLGQVAPGNVSFETHISAKPPPLHGSNIFGWGKDHLNSRKKISEVRSRLMGGDDSTSFTPREPWKGPSGRSPMVNPIQERARPPPRMHFSRSNDGLRETYSPPTIPGMAPTTITTITAGDANPHVPWDKNYDAIEVERPATNASVISTPTPPRVDLSEPDLSARLEDLRFSGLEPEAEPSSRFSVTTYDPTEVGSVLESRRSSIDTPSQSTENLNSIMSRTRPVPSSTAPGRKPVRKPTPSEVSDLKAPSQCLSEVPAQTRIQTLEARRDDLTKRKANINTMIYELTQVIQPSSIAYDMAAREEVKRTVASLNTELAEIKREEHEIGLKLLRAWKKSDNEDFYGQNSSLWVKRVTS